MPRAKKTIANELEGTPISAVPSIHSLESDDVVSDIMTTGDMTEEERANALQVLAEMDERKRIDASKRTKRNLYRTDDVVHAMDDDDLDDLITEEDIRYETFQKLNQSLVSGAILKGKIIKAEVRERNEDNPSMPTAIVQMDNDDYFRIKIPFTDFIPKDRLPESGIQGATAADKLNYMDLLINMRTGANIRFVVKKLDETTGEVIASRTEAMRKTIRDKWFSRDRRTGSYNIKLGDVLVANVLFVDRSRMCVEALGIEKNLDIADVSWIRYSNLKSAPIKPYRNEKGNIEMGSYHAGDLVRVKIVGLVRTYKEYSLRNDPDAPILRDDEIEGKRVVPNGLRVKFSVKECVENPDKKYFKDFALNEKVEAEITHVDENGIFCKLADKRSGKIYFNSDNVDLPSVGSRCLVKIVKKDEEGYKINCEIVQNYR